jgi:pyruvate dehydrogenase E2 component (dihydrolipoamide acetyltransferase)
MEIGMPSLSPTMTQGNIAVWRKKEGDEVAAGDVLCEIETDKATLEMESMEDGFLGKILVKDGAKDIPVGQAICLMVDTKEELESIGDYKPSGGGDSSPPPKKEESTPSPPPPSKNQDKSEPTPSKPAHATPSPPSGGNRIFATPAARKFAEEKNLSLSSIEGTGPDGGIVKADVEAYLASKPSPSEKSVSRTDQHVSGGAPPKGVAPIDDLSYTDIPNTQIRRITAKRLLQSKQTIPHYYLSLDIRVDKLLQLRGDLNASLDASKKKDAPTKKLSLNDFVIKAAALALQKVPEVNSTWTDEYIRQYHNVNISVAVQTEHGLMVPVVKDADKKGLATITEDVKTLAGKARSNTMKPSDYEGGTFTISNLGGPFGIKQFCAIINPPQAAILAVGTTEKRLVPGLTPDQYDVGTFMTVTMSCDHRVIDGAVGAQWLGAFKTYIEDPVTLML